MRTLFWAGPRLRTHVRAHTYTHTQFASLSASACIGLIKERSGLHDQGQKTPKGTWNKTVSISQWKKIGGILFPTFLSSLGRGSVCPSRGRWLRRKEPSGHPKEEQVLEWPWFSSALNAIPYCVGLYNSLPPTETQFPTLSNETHLTKKAIYVYTCVNICAHTLFTHRFSTYAFRNSLTTGMFKEIV